MLIRSLLRARFLVSATAGMLACGGGDPTGKMGDPEGNAALSGITRLHNEAREKVSPAPSTPLPPLSWSGTLAGAAQSWADGCKFSHSGSAYGENIYATSGTATPGDVVGSWVSEKAKYSYANNSCSGTCGHYTQVVWAASTSLGCGVKTCTQGSPFGSGSWQFWVCNYDPPGNYIGQKPY
jgi:uncharacterized protein YkwD